MRFITFILSMSFGLAFGAPAANQNPGRLRIMSWNVENLYDAVHDEGKNDYEFLPVNHPLKKQGCIEHINEKYRERCLELDWTQAKLMIKYQQIKKMVLSVGAKPDVLAVVEIENAKVLSELAAILGYSKWIITQSDDERGVDLGLMYNEKPGFKFIGQRDIPIPLNSPTRPILQGAFQFNGRRLNIYVNHWPSSAAPAEQRVTAAQSLRKAIDEDNKRGQQKEIFSVALGDFNVTAENRPYPFDVLQDKKWNNNLYDLDPLARHYVQVPGVASYFYPTNMSWNAFDKIFLSRNFFEQKALKLPVNRYEIVRTYSRDYVSKPDSAGQVHTMKQIPIRYDTRATTPEKAGFSDHFPVLFEIVAGSAQ